MRARPLDPVFAVLACHLSLLAACVAAPDSPCLMGENADTGGACAPACTASPNCPADAPICDESLSFCRACAAGEDRRCRQRSPETPRCVGGRCVACISPRGLPAAAPECSDSAPVCDRNVCRPCERHSECASGVCAKDKEVGPSGQAGSCVPAEQVLIVDQDLCSGSGPVYCTPQQAFLHISRTQRYVLLRKSALPDDFSNLTLGNLPAHQTGGAIHIIGPLADRPPHRAPGLPAVTIGGLAGRDGLTISHGRVILEGLLIRNARTGLSCTGSDTQIDLVRSFFSGNALAVSAGAGCQLNVIETWIGSGPAGSGLAGLPGNARGMQISGAEFHITNTMFVDNGDYRQDALGGINVRDLRPGSSISTVTNTTFYEQNGLVKGGKYLTSLLCDRPLGNRLVILNSLFLTQEKLLTSPEEHYIEPACGVSIYHLGSNDAALKDNESVILPTEASLFVDPHGRDLRPLAGGDANRAAIVSGGVRAVVHGNVRISGPDNDLDGKPRGQTSGQGADQVALGAFEPVPASAP